MSTNLERNSSRIAIVHDWIDAYGGAERVVEAMTDVFNPVGFYTLLANPRSELTRKLAPILKTSLLQEIPGAFAFHRYLLGFYPKLVESFDLSAADVVLSSSHCVAKGVLTRSDQLHISYIHTPARYLWDLSHAYIRENKISGLKNWYVQKVFHELRAWDVHSSNRVDLFLANSKNVARRIWRCYRRPALVVYPFVDLDRFAYKPDVKKESYFVVVSRLVSQKRVDIAVEACTHLGLKLKVIGSGPELKKLQKSAGPTVEFLGALKDAEMCDVVRRAQALIFTPEEDFGMVPLEAQALGTAVIAYGKGGALETVIPGLTGVFFQDQTAGSLVDSLKAFECPVYIRDSWMGHVSQFSKANFLKNIKNIIDLSLSRFQSGQGMFLDTDFIKNYKSG